MRISDWRSDVCSSDLWLIIAAVLVTVMNNFSSPNEPQTLNYSDFIQQVKDGKVERVAVDGYVITGKRTDGDRSEEHTSELQSLMRISYAVFCLKKKN